MQRTSHDSLRFLLRAVLFCRPLSSHQTPQDTLSVKGLILWISAVNIEANVRPDLFEHWEFVEFVSINLLGLQSSAHDVEPIVVLALQCEQPQLESERTRRVIRGHYVFLNLSPLALTLLAQPEVQGADASRRLGQLAVTHQEVGNPLSDLPL